MRLPVLRLAATFVPKTLTLIEFNRAKCICLRIIQELTWCFTLVLTIYMLTMTWIFWHRTSDLLLDQLFGTLRVVSIEDFLTFEQIMHILIFPHSSIFIWITNYDLREVSALEVLVMIFIRNFVSFFTVGFNRRWDSWTCIELLGFLPSIVAKSLNWGFLIVVGFLPFVIVRSIVWAAWSLSYTGLPYLLIMGCYSILPTNKQTFLLENWMLLLSRVVTIDDVLNEVLLLF